MAKTKYMMLCNTEKRLVAINFTDTVTVQSNITCTHGLSPLDLVYE